MLFLIPVIKSKLCTVVHIRASFNLVDRCDNNNALKPMSWYLQVVQVIWDPGCLGNSMEMKFALLHLHCCCYCDWLSLCCYWIAWTCYYYWISEVKPARICQHIQQLHLWLQCRRNLCGFRGSNLWWFLLWMICILTPSWSCGDCPSRLVTLGKPGPFTRQRPNLTKAWC